MEERCPACRMKIFHSDRQMKCENCGTTYHFRCWRDYIEKCKVCGVENPFFGEKIQSELSIKKEYEARKIAEEQARQNADAMRLAQEKTRQKAEQEKYQARINHLKATGRDGYYEYKVISIVDKKGAVDIERLMNELNDLGLDGWRLQCAYTNEMGKDSLQIAGFGINATADQNILIFERFVKFE